jgi:hypothetical protein
MSDLPNGTTARVHVDYSMADVETKVRGAFEAIRTLRKLRPAERERLWRDLAGAVSGIESVRIWLNAGAPE